ncbi:DUF4493 domain-containing protein [uncultured Alistipes sp.]|jgi:hypothetical protein|uniref:DUF4493 domain-containing protein n=1 Tax=uncultured Alistipes sp. TaxID=538949 RepID=UPI0025D8A429|nr:DUF4493 domain-containing protein [uncultured Alistipes sp.]
MKRYIIHTLLACLLLGVACSKSDTISGDGTGALAISVSATRTPKDNSYDPLEHMVVRIYNSQDGLVRKYESRDAIPERLELLAGTYRITVEAGEIVPASFSTSYYEAEETLVIKAGETIAQAVVCQPVNSVAEVEFDASVVDNFKTGYFAWVTGDDAFDEQAAEDGSVPALKFTDDGRGYYTLPEGTTSLAWMFRGTHSSRGEVEKTGVMTNVKAGGKYIFTFKYSPDLPGYIECFMVSVDPTTDDKDDEIPFKPEPTIVGAGFDNSQPQRYPVGQRQYRITSFTGLDKVTISMDGNTYDIPLENSAVPGAVITKTDDRHYMLTLSDAFISAQPAGDSEVTINIHDAEGATKSVTSTYRKEGIVPVDKKSYDLWLKTATLRVVSFDESVTATFRFKIGDEWLTMTGVRDGDFITAAFGPEWEDKNEADWFTPNVDYGLQPYSRIKAGTGIAPDKTYNYEINVSTGAQDQGQFTTPSGDIIPNGDMSGWSTTNGFAFPNAEGDTFWSSGNNTLTKTLCVSTTDKYGKAAPASKMASMNMLVMAAGNMFTGSFHYASFTGTVQFGQKYTYTARPLAMKVKYHAKVGVVNLARANGHAYKCPYIEKGDQDRSRIYVVIMDWSAPHTVISSTSATLGPWDPERDKQVDEGKVIGYGSLWVPETTAGNDMVEVELPIQWYDKTARPTEGNYTILISCACNAYGDYFTGCSSNVMYVDDFEWVY